MFYYLIDNAYLNATVHFGHQTLLTYKTLNSQFKKLEDEGFINREVFPIVPPKVEYAIIKRGQKALSLLIPFVTME